MKYLNEHIVKNNNIDINLKSNIWWKCTSKWDAIKNIIILTDAQFLQFECYDIFYAKTLVHFICKLFLFFNNENKHDVIFLILIIFENQSLKFSGFTCL